MKVVCYARVSTQDQSDNGMSLEAQQAKLAAYAAIYDLNVVEVVVDAGESAKSLHRPGLQKALDMLRKGEADGLVVYSLSRLTRELGDWQYLLAHYFGEPAGKQLHSLTEHVDTSGAMGRMVLNILIAVNQGERELTGERTREVLRHKIRNGQRVGKVRYGFDLAADGKTLVRNEAEQQAITIMVEMRNAGHTLQQIAAELTRRGILTKNGGTTWIHTAVARILKRQTAKAA